MKANISVHLFLFIVLLPSSLRGQVCAEGICGNGYGKMDNTDSYYIGHFKNYKSSGSGLTYNKGNGNIRMAVYDDNGTALISVTEFHSGDLQMGYRKKNETDGKFYLYDGFDFSGQSLSKYVGGQKSPLDFDFKSSNCLFGDCKEGFGGEYMVIKSRRDTLSYLYTGNYKEGKWEGDGTYYEFKSGDYYIGQFANNKELKGAYFNNNNGMADFIENGIKTKSFKYIIPDNPPGLTQTQNIPNMHEQRKKDGFWKTMGKVAVGVVVVAAVVEVANLEKGSQPTYKGHGTVNCKYMVQWWTENNDTQFVIVGVQTIEATSVYIYNSSNINHPNFFDSYQTAANFRQEKANSAISNGYTITYRPVPEPGYDIKTKGCANR